jgi:hypothetical protein
MRIARLLAPVAAAAALLAPAAAFAAPSGPPSSSYATAPRGLAAYASLLEHFGFDVARLRVPVEDASLDEVATVVLLDAGFVDSSATSALRDFVDDGGTLVTGGSSPTWVDALVGDPPTWDGAITDEYPTTGLEASDVATVETAGEGRWSDSGEGTVVAGTEDDALAVEVTEGEGRMTLLADASPLQNRLLDHADNAGFALALAGETPGPVVFVESVHGYGPPRGLSAFPARWRWAGAGLVGAAGLWMWSRGKRLGPPEQAERVLPPPRRAYVEALAATLARARKREGGSG